MWKLFRKKMWWIFKLLDLVLHMTWFSQAKWSPSYRLVPGLHRAPRSSSPLTGSCYGSWLLLLLLQPLSHWATRHGACLHCQVHTWFQHFVQPSPSYHLPVWPAGHNTYSPPWIPLTELWYHTSSPPFPTTDWYLDSFLADARSSYQTLRLGIIVIWHCHI